MDVGVMPAMRPEAVSNCVRLAYEFAAKVRAFVTEDSAVDALLSTVIYEFSPGETCVTLLGPEDYFLPRADEELPLLLTFTVIGRVVALIHSKAGLIAVLG
jgi:hypothetical protein